jgi:ELWxxDGT repeat protein
MGRAMSELRRRSLKTWGTLAVLAIALVTLVSAAAAATTPVLVKDIFPGSQGSFPLSLTNVNGTLFFSANFSIDGTTFDGRELWKSDGTADGTVLVKDIRPGTMSSLEEEFPTTFVTVGGTFFFRADDGTNGRELWKSDGTAAGTVLVKNINPGCCDEFGNGLNSSPGGAPPEFTNVSGTLFFSANDGTTGRELWKSDGTAAGTVLVKDIQPGAFSGGQLRNGLPQFLTDLNGTLVFGADDGINGRELWKSDGTAAGTVLVKDINPGAGSAVPFETSPFECGPTTCLNNVNGTLFFGANDGTNGIELWKSDGTAAGTVLVKDINPGTPGSSPQFLTNVNGTLFFRADDGTNGIELWKSDGTAAGTVLVEDINPGTPGSSPQFLTNVNGTLFFGANDGTNGIELWKSDGTAAGTVLVKDINPGTPGSGLRFLTNVNGTLFFRADDGSHGRELWQSDGTEAGTVLVQDIWLGPDSALPLEAAPTTFLANVTGTLFFHADDGTHGPELWKAQVGGGGGIIPGLDGAIDVIVNGPTKSVASGGSRKVFVTKACNVGTVDITVNPADISTSRTVNGASAGGTVTLLTDPAPTLLRPGACQRYRWEWSYDGDGPATPGTTVVYQATWNLAGDGFPANNTDSEIRTAT